MNFIEFRNNLRQFPVFSIDDIRKIDSEFHSQRLSEWQRKGYIKKIVSRYYYFSDTELDLRFLCFTANNIYRPSYISFETALSYYNLIPELVFNITSACTKRTYSFHENSREFYYHKIKPELYFGFNLETHGNITYKIAKPEKAILDFFYINSHLDNEDALAELRFNIAEFMSLINVDIISEFSKKFNNLKLDKRIEKLITFMNN